MFGNGGTVFFGRIPFITVPVIIGILFVETVHIIITIRFGQNRCSSYRKVFSVAFDYNARIPASVGSSVTSEYDFA